MGGLGPGLNIAGYEIDSVTGPGECFVEGFDAEFRAERVRQPPRQHRAAHPVHDHHQIEEAPGHRDVGVAGAPHLIDPRDRDPAEQVGVDLVRCWAGLLVFGRW